jgi:CMP-2-keto-3-deoxyoctulosonic acid synthetase
MTTLYQQIGEKFLAKLAASKDADTEKIEQLRVLLADGKKVKSEDFVKIFSAPAGGDLK